MKRKKDYNKFLLYGFLIFVLIILSVSIFSVGKLIFTNPQTTVTNSMQRLSTMGLTAYDKQLAIKFMDSNHDGKCDACGMDVELCMSSGQIQCNMDPKSTIGLLGSQHIHADWKVFVNGKAIDFSKYGHDVIMNTDPTKASSFIHVHTGDEVGGSILHMHATGVPLWIFFESIGMKFNKDCLTLDNGEKYCNDGRTNLKFYVNGEPNEKWENYVFNDLDKILISYGSENDLTQQLNSITDFAKNH